MLGRRGILGVAVSIAISLLPSAANANWCGQTDRQNWNELYSLLGADLSTGSARPMVFIAGGVWCPNCTAAIKTLRTREFAFDVRFVPIDSISERDRDKLADIVVDGTSASLLRVFIQRSPAKQVPVTQHALANRVNRLVTLALEWRFKGDRKLWGSAIGLVLTKNGITTISGQLNLDAFERAAVMDDWRGPKTATRRFLEAGVPEPKPIIGKPHSNKENVRLRILPDAQAFSVQCLGAGIGFPDAEANRGYITVDGQNWLVFNLSVDYPEVVAYGRAADFSGWRPR